MKFSFVLSLLLLGAAGRSSIVLAQSGGTFTPAGNMITARDQHTATLLLDGLVLIAGGESLPAQGQSLLASAELYDPSSGTFTATGSMTTARRMHTATLLPDGKVLIAGGYDLGNGPSASAELYDPKAGTFTATGNMLTPQGFPTATLLNNGKVLIAGGFATSWPSLANAELYDPATGTFGGAGGYATSTYTCDFCSPAALLPGGNVLLGRTQPAQLYDPVSGTFAPTGAMHDVDRATATLLLNSKVLFAGGESIGRLSSAELYDSATGSFTSARDMGSKRAWHTATLLPDGTVLMAGGESEVCGGNSCFFSGSLASAELYDPSTGVFTATGSMAARREVHTATLLNDGSVFITGGVAYGGIGVFFGSLANAEIYHPAVLIPAPALFSISGDGTGQGAILHANTPRIASSTDAAVAGEYLEIYLTGLADGSVIPPQVSIGGKLAQLTYFGKSGYPGVNQVNVRVPSGVAPGPAVPVRLTYIGRPSNAVTIGVQ